MKYVLIPEIERENYRDKLEQAVEFRITELKAKTDQLEQANRDLEGFSYSVSHNLRSPLRAIDGFITILRDEYGNNLDEEGLRLFSIVQNNARKMCELIDDILAFSRAGRMQLEMQDLDMVQLVKSVSQDVKQQYQESHIVVYYGDLPPVKADPGAIRQVLFNLINNAVKFSALEDHVVIDVEGEKCDDFIRYSVKDNGIGFNNDYKDKLFVIFQRLHGMEEFEGTGVGLAIVKRFIQKHGGKVSAHGAQGEGATFSFELPFR
ncbi:MAG: ATP-binding protein [Candidatus Thiodiazotropha sp. 4PDIVS1]